MIKVCSYCWEFIDVEGEGDQRSHGMCLDCLDDITVTMFQNRNQLIYRFADKITEKVKMIKELETAWKKLVKDCEDEKSMFDKTTSLAILSVNEELQKSRLRFKRNIPDPRVTAFRKWYCDAHLRLVGDPYDWKWGQDGTNIKALLKIFELPELQRRALIFLKQKDWFLNEATGHTIGMFRKRINSKKLAEKSENDASIIVGK